MDSRVLKRLEEMALGPEALEESIQCLADMLQFLKAGDCAVILFPGEGPHQIGWLMAQAVRRCGGVPVFWTEDMRWKALLRLCFSSRATTVIGPPLLLLGLAKLARMQKTPLKIFHAVTAGYPCTDWMIEGITKGLDCTIRGCFDLEMGPVICGTSCPSRYGVHIRDTLYGIDLIDSQGNPVPEGELGHIVVYAKAEPQLRYHQGKVARLTPVECTCGRSSVLLTDFQPGPEADHELLSLYRHLCSWMSILDCEVQRGEYGLELTMIVFPGEKLPQLPSCAKLSVRLWDPERDTPLGLAYLPSGTFI